VYAFGYEIGTHGSAARETGDPAARTASESASLTQTDQQISI